MRTPSFLGKRSAFAFTVAELVITISILAILSAIALIAYGGYQRDAQDSAVRTNIRSLYTAISTESASSGKSARYYVQYVSDLSLTGGVVVFDTYPLSLNGGDWDNHNANYSAGYPDFQKLKLSEEKFRISYSDGLKTSHEASAATSSEIFAGAVAVKTPDDREKSYVQVAGILSSGFAAVAGDYPVGLTSDSLGGLIKDSAVESETGALIDGLPTGLPPNCESATIQGYDVPGLSSGQTTQVTRTIANGSVMATAKCSFGKLSILNESPSCATGYVPGAGLTCVADVCGQNVPANAVSTATSQSVTTDWHYSSNPGQCTFSCSVGYSWDGNACRQDCSIPATVVRNGLTFAVSSIGPLPHGVSASRQAVHSFGLAPANGTLTVDTSFSCADGSVTASVTDGPADCETNFTWNSNRSAPQCTADTRTVSCQSSVPVNGTANTPATYVQTWNGSSWGTDLSWTSGAATCGFACNTNYVLSGGSCVAATRTQACVGLPSSAAWNTVSSISQTWNGSAWSPSVTGSHNASASASECRFKCDANYTWNGSACVANTQNFTCAAKPATGTVWNTVSSYTQTWNGTSWTPANSVTAYDTAASNSACRYKCDAGYGWDSSASLCKAAVGGSCGTANSVSTYLYPTSGWCATGAKSDVDTGGSDGGFDWTCSGEFGGTAATCSAPKKANAICGTSHGAILTSAPSSNLCATGAPSAVTGSGPWSWTCSGVNGGNSASCTASLATYSVSGSFGANAASVTVTGCGKSVVADSSGAFSFTSVSHGTACNNISTSKTNYTCTTTANGPTSLAGNASGLGGGCSPNSQTVSCGGAIPASANATTAPTYSQTWNGSSWAPSYSWAYSAGVCGYACSSGYHTENGGASCVTNTRACSIPNGAGSQTWNGSAWGTCEVVSCSTGYVPQ